MIKNMILITVIVLCSVACQGIDEYERYEITGYYGDVATDCAVIFYDTVSGSEQLHIVHPCESCNLHRFSEPRFRILGISDDERTICFKDMSTGGLYWHNMFEENL